MPNPFPKNSNSKDMATEEVSAEESNSLPKSRKDAKPPYSATITSLASERSSSNDSTVGVAKHILDRICKMLARGDEMRNTSEHEAQTAMRLATRLMSEHNVKQADAAALAAASGKSQQIGGMSTVTIKRSEGSKTKRVVNETWVGILVRSMEIFFDCKSFSLAARDHDFIKWTFYGISANTEAAANGLQMTFGLAQHWALTRKGSKNSYYIGVSEGLVDIAKQEKASEMQKLLTMEKEQKLLQAQSEDEVQLAQPAALRETKLEDDIHIKVEPASTGNDALRTAAMAAWFNRISTPGPGLDALHTSGSGTQDSEMSSSDDDGDDDDNEPDIKNEVEDPDDVDVKMEDDDPMELDATFQEGNEAPIDLTGDTDYSDGDDVPMSPFNHSSPSHDSCLPGSFADVPKHAPLANRAKSTARQAESDSTGHANGWQNSMQLQLFRKNAQTIADDTLKSASTKLKKGRKRTYRIADKKAYKDGVRDSKKVDVRGNRIAQAKT